MTTDAKDSSIALDPAVQRAWRWLVEGHGRLVLIAATVLFAVIGLGLLVATIQANGLGWDYRIYSDRAADFMAGRGFYLPRQLSGPYVVQNGDALYPPPALLLFVPFLYLPPFLYWAIPLGITAAVVIWHRPALWAWPLLAAIPVVNLYLRFEITKGNPGLWALAFLSLATVWPFFAPFVAFKWGLAPFALFGIWRRQWWAGAAVALVINLAFLPMWLDYVRVVLDARGNTVGYMLGEYPMMLIPLVAWAASRRTRRRRVAADDPDARSVGVDVAEAPDGASASQSADASATQTA